MIEVEQTVLWAFVVLGGVRLVASWFLPAFGPSRVERESLLVFVLSASGLVVVAARRRIARKAMLGLDATSHRADVFTDEGEAAEP